jgi:hypothetical protein
MVEDIGSQKISIVFGSSEYGDFWRSREFTVKSNDEPQVDLAKAPVVTRKESMDPKDFFRSVDSTTSVMSSNSVSQAFLGKLLASKDNVFASIDPLPLQSVDSAFGRTAAGNNDDVEAEEFALPDIFASFEVLTNHKKGKMRTVGQAHELFKTGEHSTTSVANFLEGLDFKSSDGGSRPTNPQPTNFLDMYKQNLANPLQRRSETSTPTTQPQSESSSATPKKLKSPSRRVEPKVKVYVEPMDDDILMGRGGRSNLHPGNNRYRQAVEDLKPEYRVCNKYEKTVLSQKLVDDLMAEGRRFIELEESTKKWYVVPNLRARRKAGQALREENTPEARALKRKKYTKKQT